MALSTDAAGIRGTGTGILAFAPVGACNSGCSSRRSMKTINPTGPMAFRARLTTSRLFSLPTK